LVPPILRIQYFSEALRAGGDVGKHEDRFLPSILALTDFEGSEAEWIKERELEALDERSGRFLLLYTKDETIQNLLFPFNFDEDTLSRVRHPTRELHL
jgi:hypothetical protein